MRSYSNRGAALPHTGGEPASVDGHTRHQCTPATAAAHREAVPRGD